MIVKELITKKMYKEFSMGIPYQEVANAIDSKINVILPTVELPGFRKGKAPFNIVKKKYENTVLSEVIESIVKNNIKKLLDDKKLKPLRQPKIEISKYEKDNPLELKIKIDLEPELQLIDFKKLKTKKYEIKIDNKNYEENYNDYIKSQKTYSTINNNRSIKMGDRVHINLKSDDKNVPDFLVNQENITLYTDSDYQILPDLSKELIKKNAKVDEVINISFDLKDILKEKKEKLTPFEIKIITIEEKKDIKIDKNFLEKNNLKSEKELKDKINLNLKNNYNNLIKEIEKKQLYDLLESKHDFDIPEGIFEEEYNQIWSRVENAKKNKTLDDDDKKISNEDLKKRYKDIATRRVKLAILVQKIAANNSITVSNDELTNGLLEYASQYPGQEKQIFEYFKKNPSQMENVRGPIFENKVFESVLSLTSKENKSITVDEFKKLQKETFIVKD